MADVTALQLEREAPSAIEVLLAVDLAGLEVAARLHRPGRRLVFAPLLAERALRTELVLHDIQPDALLFHSAADWRPQSDTAKPTAHFLGDLILPPRARPAARTPGLVALLLEAPFVYDTVVATAALLRNLIEHEERLVFTAVPELAFALSPLLTRGERVVPTDDLAIALAEASAALVPQACDGARVPVVEALAAGLVPLALATAGDNDDLDLRCLRLADQATLAAALVDPTLWKDPEAPVETSASDSFEAALTAFGEAIGLDQARHTRPDTVEFARNLAVSFTSGRQSFNPWTRLLWCEFELKCEAPMSAISAEWAGPQGSEMFNDWVWISTAPGGMLRLKAVMILPLNLAPGDTVVEVRVWGRIVARLEVPTDIAHETAGLIGLNAGTGDHALVEAWAAGISLPVQIGRSTLKRKLAPVVPDRPAYGRFEAVWPFNRPTLTLLPEVGIGQRFTNFDGYTGARRASSPQFDRMQGSCAGQTAWLIGNGPSVRVADLDRLADRVTFGFNRLYLAYDQTRLRPTYTVTGDQQMIEDFGDEILARSSGTIFVSAAEAPDLTGSYQWVRQAPVFPHLFSRDAPRIVTAGGSSLYIAMQIGFWLGIRRFYIYGADFRFSFQRNADRDPYRAATGEGNHFIANYRSGLAWCPPAFETITGAFLAARQIMESEGGFIRNATRGGALDLFERIDFDDAIAQP